MMIFYLIGERKAVGMSGILEGRERHLDAACA